MAKDLVYVFDKITKKGTLFGEIQEDFNMSNVIDGTKDSLKVIVCNWQHAEIEPYSIILHKKTATWWIVSHDKVERNMNESSFLYKHKLELIGAIELLNARDLIDCGFNDNTYTINEFITRLFGLSNFEYSFSYVSGTNASFLAKNVDFIKTFENYTLLSALREFLDAYNMCPKLTFATTYDSVNDIYTITNAVLHLISKTGNSNLGVYDINNFGGVMEIKTMDKDSFGATVVSNAENVISTKSKIYPSSGSCKLSSTQFKVTTANAIFRLPSKVYKGICLKCHFPLDFEKFTDSDQRIRCYPTSYASIESLFDKMKEYVRDHTSINYQQFLADFESKKESIVEKIMKASTCTLYDGNTIDPTYNNGEGKIYKGANVPYLANLFGTLGGISNKNFDVIFTDKDTRAMLPHTKQGVAWERGSDLITGFELLDSTYITSLMSTDLQSNNNVLYSYGGTTLLKLWRPQQQQTAEMWQALSVITTWWSIEYIPMNDIKIKVDNTRDKKDIQLYNQNGRITDNVALSKLLNSYSKEISSDTITRYSYYYDYSNVPKVGSFVIAGNETYVINNVSLDFYQCESKYANDFNYFIEAEITMSKYCSTKSLLVSPNTNIRDYGIPQNYNVKRKQLYRDYYQLSYASYTDADTNYYLEPQNTFTFLHSANEFEDFIAVIKITYDHTVDGSTEWYYQLDTTNYYLDKMVYILLDFKDNNIIGYGNQNTRSAFDVSKIFDPAGHYDNLNTPISYVDENGRVDGIYIKLCTNEELTTVYEDYQDSEGYGGDAYQDICLYNYSCFIPQDIYDNSTGTIILNEQYYEKDANEVPVFEYACQIDDSEDVIIGANIMAQYNNRIYFYTYVVGDNLTQENCFDNQNVRVENYHFLVVNNGAEIEYYNQYTTALRLRLYATQTWDNIHETWSNGNQQNFTVGKDYAVFRHAYNLSTREDTVELMFIAKKVPSSNILNSNILTIMINHYKLN